ncbi:hypothetical protein Dimus_008178, partial [Dionaea muscipula]
MLFLNYPPSFSALSCEFASVDVSDILGTNKLHITKTIHKFSIDSNLRPTGSEFHSGPAANSIKHDDDSGEEHVEGSVELNAHDFDRRGCGEEGELRRFLPDATSKLEFLLEAALQCLEAGLYDKAIEIHKRVGAYVMALDTVNKCLAEANSALSRGRLEGQSRTANLIHSGNEIVETCNYYPCGCGTFTT